MKKEYPEIDLKREDPYALFREAATRGWIHFRPPLHIGFETRLRRENRFLRNVTVAHTTTVRGVAEHAAEALLDLLLDYRREHKKSEVHVGFAGGHAMRAVAIEFANLLCERPEGLPESIVFHAMASGFDPTDPTTDPNAFFSYFVDQPAMQIKPRFMGLSAPSMIKRGDMRRLRELPEIKAAFAAVGELDIIVTSGTSWDDDHSALRKRMLRSSRSMSVLRKEACLGDVLWRPIAARGPIEMETDIRALTLFELSALPEFIKRGNHVLLALAPCGDCHRPKGRLLRCLLKQSRPLITDLVVDSCTVGEMIRLNGGTTDH